MNFIKGMVIGGMAAMGAMVMYNEIPNKTKKRMMKRGRIFMKRMGMM